MRISLISAICLAFLAQAASGGDTISPKTLAVIKRATVFVKVDSKGYAATGSGFIIKVDGDTALVVTNHHVIEPKIQVQEAAPRPFNPFPNPFGPFGPSGRVIA